MEITNIKKEIYRRYLLVQGWSDVIGLLQTYAEGDFRGSRSEHNRAMRDLTVSGGGSPFVAHWPGIVQPSSGFLKRLTTDIHISLSAGDEYRRSFDYDGPGPFFKAGVDVFKLAPDLYGVGFSTGGGNPNELALAEKYELPMGMIWGEVGLTTNTVDGKFVFDFAPVAEKLSRVLDTPLDGEQIAKAMLPADRFAHARTELYRDELLAVSLHCETLGIKLQYESPWTVDGSVLTGEADVDRYSIRYFPTMKIHVRKVIDPKVEKYLNAPIVLWKPKDQALLESMTEAIYRAFV